MLPRQRAGLRLTELRKAEHALLDASQTTIGQSLRQLILGKIRTPLSLRTTALDTGAGNRPRLQLESSATRPPGASTRTISSTARIGSSIRYSAAKQQTASKLPS